jgi:hypothetical protein
MIQPADFQQPRHVIPDMKLLAVVTMSSSFSRVITSCTSDKNRRFFGGKYGLHLQDRKISQVEATGNPKYDTLDW